PTVTPAAGATKTLTVNLTDGTNNYIDITSGADIYVILPPMASKNLTMRVYNTDGGMSSKTVSSTTLARKNIYTNTVSNIAFEKRDYFGPFSVAADRQVYLAPGNLQWSATGGGTTLTTHTVAGGGTACGTWRFAANQWDIIGDAAGNNTADANRETQADWIDLFGWGTSGYDNIAKDPGAINFQPWASAMSTEGPIENYYGYGPSTDMTNPNIAGSNYDWGVYNAIYNPQANTTDPAGTWRTPTKDEWVYVLNTRPTSSGVRYAKAKVNGVPGLIIVPDNWSTSTYALYSTNTTNAAYTTNEIDSAQWTTLENAGCAFLPAAGDRNGTSVYYVGSGGYYWSATYYNSYYASYLYFYSGNVGPSDYYYRYLGQSVSLVRSAE
ncbi:MAG: hypothetical protein IJP95_03905, partial [Bacteroidales bacterium]|nr:hypothetical protein [Bacteroidales bacterium]